jgi:Ran GTPase-activating protein (RanGAP) involved in mRNA processing and transport
MSALQTLSPTFLSACAKLRLDDLSVVPEWLDFFGRNDYFRIKQVSTEAERVEIAKALTQSTAVTMIELRVDDYSEEAAEAMGFFLRSSKHLHNVSLLARNANSKSQRVLSIFLRGLEDSIYVREVYLECSMLETTTRQALTGFLIRSKTLRKLDISSNEEMHPVLSCLARNKTLQDLTLTNDSSTRVTSIHPCLGDNPALKTLRINSTMMGMSGLDTLLRNDNSKITELILDLGLGRMHDPYGFESVLQTLRRTGVLTKLEILGNELNEEHAEKLTMLLRDSESLHTLVLSSCCLEEAGIATDAQVNQRAARFEQLFK